MIAEGIAEVAIRRNVLVERVVLIGVDIDKFALAKLGAMPPSATANMSARQVLGMCTGCVFIKFQEPLGPLRLINARPSRVSNRPAAMQIVSPEAVRITVTRRVTDEKKRRTWRRGVGHRGISETDAVSESA